VAFPLADYLAQSVSLGAAKFMIFRASIDPRLCHSLVDPRVLAACRPSHVQVKARRTLSSKSFLM
jgi:hypothetical protein